MTPPAQNIPFGTCHCGCYKKTTVHRLARPSEGIAKGQPRLFVAGHQFRKSPVVFSIEDMGYITPCWVWKQQTDGDGYGHRAVNSVPVPAHRFVYEAINGKQALPLDHLCRVRACVRPDHLEPVTSQENTRRGDGAKLNPGMVAEIRDMRRQGLTFKQISQHFKIGITCAFFAATGRNWADVDSKICVKVRAARSGSGN